MSIDFPSPATDQQVFSAANGVVYKYSAAYSSWLAQNAAPAIGGTGDFFATGSPGLLVTTTPANAIPATVITGNSGIWYNTTTGRYTPPAGRYNIFASTQVQGSSGGAVNVIAYLYKNGAAVPNVSPNSATAAANAQVAITVEAIVDANGSDYFEIKVAASVNSTLLNTSFGASPLTGMQGPTGPAGVTQTVFFETGGVLAGSTLIPADDTIPQNTEGDQYMSLAITPQSATSKLIIDVTAVVANSAANNNIAALFQDSTANALAATVAATSSNQLTILKLTHIMTSGTTSATTFKLRMGGSLTGTLTFNGQVATRLFGGVMASSIVIREVP